MAKRNRAGGTSRELVPFPGGASGNGAVGGGQVGWNYQAGPWVLGVEAAISAADINAGTACAAGAFICSVNVDGLGTATGRLGFAFDQFLVYGKAGAAVEHSRDAMVLRPFTAFSFNGSATRSGWTAGTGVEFAFNPALSAFAEYDFLDFGTRGIAMIDSTGVGARVALSEHVHLVKVGLNYKLGQNLSSWTAAARALPLFPVPPASLNWTGVYIGGHVGGGWGQTNWNSATGVLGNGTTVFAGSGTDNGFAIGGQVGVNYQVGPWVMGFEADADWSDLDGNAPCAASAASASGFTCHTHINGFGTLAGRLGQAFGNLLVYGKGGAAWDSESHFALDSNLAPNAFAANDTRWGWAIGAGLEYAFTPAWSGKVEYDYLSFANRAVAFSDGAGNVSNVGLSQSINVVKMGFNYKLGADPASPAYAAAAVPMWVKAPVFKAPPPSDWTIEAGARYWVSSGRKQLDLAANQADVLLSRLTYDSVAGQAAEAFARLDHRDGMFLKGNFGLGDLQGGRFYDEDIRPAVVPYSDTISSQRDGRTLYGSLDVGHMLIRGASGDIGAYVGYRYLYERDNAFGFRQLATNEIVNLPFLSSDVLGITETEAWNGLAVGLQHALPPGRPLADRSRCGLAAIPRRVGQRQSLAAGRHQSAAGTRAGVGIAVRGNSHLRDHGPVEHRCRRTLLVLRDVERVLGNPADQALQRALRRFRADDLQVRRSSQRVIVRRGALQRAARTGHVDRLLRGRQPGCWIWRLELVGSVRADVDRRPGPRRRRARRRAGRRQLSGRFDRLWYRSRVIVGTIDRDGLVLCRKSQPGHRRAGLRHAGRRTCIPYAPHRLCA